MMIKNKKTINKPLIIGVAIAVLIVAGLFIYFFFFASKDPTDNYRPEYPVTQNDSESNNPNNTDTVKVLEAQPSPQTSDSIPVSDSGLVSISSLNQRDGFVNALADVQNFSASKCVYMFESDGAKPVIREQSGSCSGISIPQVEFEKIGKYKLTVTVYDGDSKISTSGEINVT